MVLSFTAEANPHLQLWLAMFRYAALLRPTTLSAIGGCLQLASSISTRPTSVIANVRYGSKAYICSAIDHIRFSHYWSALGQKPAAERDVTYISSIRVDNKSSMMQRCRLNFASRFRQQHEELFPASVRRCSSPLLTLNVEIAC